MCLKELISTYFLRKCSFGAEYYFEYTPKMLILMYETGRSKKPQSGRSPNRKVDGPKGLKYTVLKNKSERSAGFKLDGVLRSNWTVFEVKVDGSII